MNPRILFHLFAVAALLASPAVAQKTEKKEAQKSDSAKKDPFKVPDGTPAELVKYIQTTQANARKARSLDMFRKHQKAVIAAADKLLSKKIDDKMEVTGIQAKFMALSFLGRFGDANAAKSLQKFAKSLENHKNKKIAEMASTQLLVARSQRVFGMKPAERKELVKDLLAFLEKGDLRQKLGVAMSAARGLENSGSRELAANMYKGMAKILAKAKDERLKNYAPKMEGSARRVMLLGNTIDIKGTTVDGKPFNWSDYKGKVVLIDFWATWCGPCIAELPNVKSMYEKYHDRGFEVVGISLDQSKSKLEAFIKKRDLKWTNLFSTDPKKTGWDHPMATYYGIMGIPNVILVDQKGKVVSLNARGRELQMQLKKLIGPVEEVPSKDKKPKE